MVLSLLMVGLSGGQLDLQPDVLQNGKQHLAKNLAPKTLTKVSVVLLECLLESIEGFVADCFTLLCDQACKVSKDGEPQLLQDAQTNSIR